MTKSFEGGSHKESLEETADTKEWQRMQDLKEMSQWENNTAWDITSDEVRSADGKLLYYANVSLNSKGQPIAYRRAEEGEQTDIERIDGKKFVQLALNKEKALEKIADYRKSIDETRERRQKDLEHLQTLGPEADVPDEHDEVLTDTEVGIEYAKKRLAEVDHFETWLNYIESELKQE